jgi:hypothetical protein
MDSQENPRLDRCIAALKAKVLRNHVNRRGCRRNHYAGALSYIQPMDSQLPGTTNITSSDSIKLLEEMGARPGRVEFPTLSAARKVIKTLGQGREAQMSGDQASEKEYPSIKKGSDRIGNPNEAGLQGEQSNRDSRTSQNPASADGIRKRVTFKLLGFDH